MQLASATHYLLVLRQFQDKLNNLTPRKIKNPSNLLLTTLMLSQIEVCINPPLAFIQTTDQAVVILR